MRLKEERIEDNLFIKKEVYTNCWRVSDEQTRINVRDDLWDFDGLRCDV